MLLLCHLVDPVEGGTRFLAVGSQGGGAELFVANSGDGVSWSSVLIKPGAAGDSLVSATYVPSLTAFSWFVCSSFGNSFVSTDGTSWVTSKPFFQDVPQDCAGVAAGPTPRGAGVAMAYNSPSSSIDSIAGDATTLSSLPIDVNTHGTISGIAYAPQSQRWFALTTDTTNVKQSVLTWDASTWSNVRVLVTYTLLMTESLLIPLNSKDTVFFVGGRPITATNIAGMVLTYDTSTNTMAFRKETSQAFKTVAGAWISPRDGTSIAKVGLQPDASGGKAFNSDTATPTTLFPSASVIDYSRNVALVGGTGGSNIIGTMDLLTLREGAIVDGTAFGNPEIVAMASIPYTSTSSSGGNVQSAVTYSDNVVTPAGSSLQVGASVTCAADWIVWGTAVLTPAASVSVGKSLQLRGVWTQYASAAAWNANNLLIGDGATLNVTLDKLPSSAIVPTGANNATFTVTIPLGTFASKNVSNQFQVLVFVTIPPTTTRATTTTTLVCTTTTTSSAAASASVGSTTLSAVVTLQQTCVPGSAPSDGLSTAALIGIIVGSVAGALLIAIIIIGLVLRRRRQKKLFNDLKNRSKA